MSINRSISDLPGKIKIVSILVNRATENREIGMIGERKKLYLSSVNSFVFLI